MVDWQSITDKLRLPFSKGSELGLSTWLTRIALVVAVAYVAASSLSAYLMSTFLTSSLSAIGRTNAASKATATLSAASMSGGDNYRDIIKAIKDRNLFNSAGVFPEEKDPEGQKDKGSKSTFDLNGPCNKASVNVTLLGTLYVDGGNSLATMQEQGYAEADIYREGDLIIGNDNATIAKIERNRVVLNNNGVKECLELAAAPVRKDGGAFPDAQPSRPPEQGGTVTGAGAAPDATPVAQDCSFDEKYVQDELGPGFGTIIQKARLVPNTTDNVMNGFKIFAIDQSSLLGKTGLQNGDIITQVNETSLKQPEQGFTLYQAFQDDREVRIHILRRGTTPMTITCRIK